ncbi:hypothetical protein AB0I30_31625 [Nocardia tengchongensis]|uniref:hypothetical protein n=1 Tax=Nocardia tengchongensis TaxID=2055889 RepID=UPI0033E728CC
MLLDHTKQRIAAVARKPGNLDLFAIDNDDKPATTFWTANNGWRGDWMTLPGDTTLDHRTQQITVIARQPGNLDLFAIGNDDKPVTTFWTANDGWRGDWMTLPGNTLLDHTTQCITAVARKPGNLDLFAIGNDDKPVTTFWTANDGWRGDWMTLPGDTTLDHRTQQITVIARQPGNLDLFAIGNDDKPVTTFWTANDGWRGDWMTLPGNTLLDHTTQCITAVARKPGNLDLFAIGNDGRPVHTLWTANDGWHGRWLTLPGTLLDHKTQRLAALSHAQGLLELYAIGPDNKPWSIHWFAWNDLTPTGWLDRDVHGSPALDHTMQRITAVRRSPDHTDLFAIANDGHAITTFTSVDNDFPEQWMTLPGS